VIDIGDEPGVVPGDPQGVVQVLLVVEPVGEDVIDV